MDVKNLLDYVVNEATFVASSVRSRGARHYGRALAMAGFAVFASYSFVYKKSAVQLGRVQLELVAARATAEHANTFRDLDDRLRIFAERLPPAQNAEAWLLDQIRESMKAEGIFSTSLSPVNQSVQGRFLFLSMTIACRASYKQMASWIARMERSRQLLHISNMSLRKDAQEVGMNDVTLTIGSVLPKEKGLP